MEPRELADSLSSCTPLKKKGKEKKAGRGGRGWWGGGGLKAAEKSVLFGKEEQEMAVAWKRLKSQGHLLVKSVEMRKWLKGQRDG